MAASDPDMQSERAGVGGPEILSAAGLRARLAEEIGRAERHGTDLSCLLVVFDNLEALTGEHGEELREEVLAYAARALGRELRCFDRVGLGDSGLEHLLVLLPGADGPRGEIVARRTLERLRAIKVEAGGARLALEVSVGLAAWRQDMSAQQLLALARAAVQRNGDNGAPRPAGGPPDVPAPGGDGGQAASGRPGSPRPAMGHSAAQ